MNRVHASVIVCCVYAIGLAGSGARDGVMGQTMPAPRTGDTLVLSLEDAQRLALANNPDLRAERLRTQIARGELTQARTPAFNPGFELRAPGVASSEGAYEASLIQEIEWAGQRGLRTRAAESGLVGARLLVGDETRRTLAETGIAFYEAFTAHRQLDLTREVRRLTEQLHRAVEIQLREGEISALESNLAGIELGRARARVLTAQRDANAADIALRRLLGLPAGQALIVDSTDHGPHSFGSATGDSLIALALTRRADLAAQRATVQQMQLLTQLSRREAMPNLSVEALAESSAGGGTPRFGFGVGIPIPLWNRNAGLIAQRSAQATQATLRADAITSRIQMEVGEAHASYLAATQEVDLVAREVLHPARENQQLLEAAYRAGKIDLATLLLVRNQLLEAEFSYWDAWRAQHLAYVRLQSVTAALPTDVVTDNK